MFSIVRRLTTTVGHRLISFTQLGVNSTIVNQLAKQNITEATLIQEKVIPLGLRECSPIVISSETGSGKTLAYLIPYLESYLKNPTKRMLIFVPQRELAYQVDTVLHRIVPEVKSSILVSGSNGIASGKKPNVVIGTPALMNEFIKEYFSKVDSKLLQEKNMTISHIVFDEADMMLTQKQNKCPFTQSLRILTKHNPSLQILFVGATLPRNGKRSVGGIIQNLYDSTFWCEGEYSSRIPPSIDLHFKELSVNQKSSELVQVLPKLREKRSLIFVNSERSVKDVCYVLEKYGVHYQTLTKKLLSEERKEALKLLNHRNKVPLCTVCRGLVARGLDTMNVDFVLNYDFPEDIRQFIHRCGRTGRQGRSGEVLSFVSPSDAILYESIQRVGVYNDLSKLYSRHRKLNRRYKEHNQKFPYVSYFCLFVHF